MAEVTGVDLLLAAGKEENLVFAGEFGDRCGRLVARLHIGVGQDDSGAESPMGTMVPLMFDSTQAAASCSATSSPGTPRAGCTAESRSTP